MSAYSGTPTLVRSWSLGDRTGKQVGSVKYLTITISSQGGATNTIGATALGFVAGQIYDVVPVNFTDAAGPTNRSIFAWTDGTYIYLGDPQVGTDADRGDALDMSGTLTLKITGQSA